MTNKLQMKMVQSCLDSCSKLDSAKGLYLADLVNETLGEIYEAEYPNLGWASGDLIYLETSLDAGALGYDAVHTDSFGRARLVDPDGDDIPTSGVDIHRENRPYHHLVHSFHYNTQDLRSSDRQSRLSNLRSVIDLKADSCKLGHDEELNDLIAFGDEAKGLYGVTNHPGILVSNAGTGNWTSPATTADQIYADAVLMIQRMKAESRGVYVPDTMVVGPEVMSRLQTTWVNSANGSNITLKMAFEQNFSVMVKEEATMELASESGENAVLLYQNNAKRVQVPMPLYLAPIENAPEIRGRKFLVILESLFGGVSAQYPKSILRLDGV